MQKSKKNCDDLERVQKSAVRIILGKPYESYSEAIKEIGIMKLAERREAICLKFAKNSLRIANFRELFPEFKNSHLMKTRNMEKFAVNRFHGKRYAVSAVPNMQKLLNKEYRKQKESIKKLLSPTNYACTRSYC